MSVIRQIYDTLCEHYDMQPLVNSWLNNPLDVIIGSVLVQGSTWRVVVKVLNLLRERSLLSFQAIVDVDDELLSGLIRSAGFQVKKTKRLKDIARIFLNYGNGNINTFFARDIDQVRQELLKVSGLSPRTVDNIILYAGKLPIYVVDPYTARIFRRHEIVSAWASDADIQQFIHFELVPDEEPYGAKLFSELQTFMVKLGRTCCGIPQPDCSQCPLAILLPATGVRNINIPDEPTIPPIAVILANRLRLKTDRPKIPELTTVQSESITPTTKKQKTNKKESVTPPQVKTQQKIITNTQNKNQTQQLQSKEPSKDLKLSDVEKQIVEKIGLEPVQIDLIVQATQLPVHIVRATIAILEMKKILQQVEGNRVASLISES
ncbi:MAG: hypothetical protein LBC74_10500 [Planctomycetaceae bacterium]|jgi:endonuclease-3 related protein|nr:hypothetical protein [Planctomycetaceae bacterium]